MRKMVTPVILLLAAIVHAPLPAQARLFELLPYPLTTSEPVVLVLTGLALLSLGRFGSHRIRPGEDHRALPDVRPVPAMPDTRRDETAPHQRAA
jgi:hypothetical protein